MARERGAPICQAPDGRLVLGPIVQGTRESVTIPHECAPGQQLVGTWHTHPGGVAIPSDQDLRTATAADLAILCISVPERHETSCYVPRRPD